MAPSADYRGCSALPARPCRQACRARGVRRTDPPPRRAGESRARGVGRPSTVKLSGITTLSVASLNTHCGFDSRGEPFDLASAVGKLDAAVICLQEVWHPAADGGTRSSGTEAADPVADAAKRLGAELHRAKLHTWPTLERIGIPQHSGPGDISIAVLSTVPVISYKVLELGVAAGDQVPRLAQVFMLQLPDGPVLRLVNTHLTYVGTSVLQLLRLLRGLHAEAAQASDHVPTIIIGDFNMPRFLASRAPGYTAVVRGRTWPAEQPLVQLDHVLTSPDVVRIDGTVLPPAGSDHLPIRALLRIPARVSSRAVNK